MNKLIIANWKSNKNIYEAKNWVEVYSQTVTNRSAKVVICPSFVLLETVIDALLKTQAPLDLGIQTLSPYPAGSYTGAISIKNIEGLPIKYAVLGHSERRQYFHETSNDIAKQIDQAISAGIKPIVCVDKDYITSQAAAIADEAKEKCIIAYEPASLIGTGIAEDYETVQQIISKIKHTFGQAPVLYGGSVAQNNVASYLDIADGVLIGSASLEAQSFAELVNSLT